MNSIKIRGLRKSFGINTVLRDIDCTVKEGSVHGFLGPNGAGKTTTIKIILGLYRADAGEVELFGKPIRFGHMEFFNRDIGYLGQDPVFPDQYSGIEVLEFVADLHHVSRAERVPRIKELLRRFDLLEAGHRQVKNYSRGMKQRLGLATVWLPKPNLLILDEPVSALDPQGRYDVLEQIKELKGNSTVFFSSHILADVERVADQVTIISKGVVVFEGSMDSIRDQYVSSAFSLRVPFEKKDRAREILAAIPELTHVSVEENTFFLQTEKKAVDISRKKVLYSMLEADVEVLRFSLQEATLEDVFLQLISGGGQT